MPRLKPEKDCVLEPHIEHELKFEAEEHELKLEADERTRLVKLAANDDTWDDTTWRLGMPVKHQRFVDEYCIDLDCKRAAIVAGFDPEYARMTGSKLLHNFSVAYAIHYRISKLGGVTGTKILDELRHLAFSNMGDFVEWDSEGGIRVKDSNQLTPIETTAISQITSTTSPTGAVTIKLKLYDKISALEKIGKALSMFVTKHEVTGLDGEPLRTEQVIDVTALTPEQRAAMRSLLTGDSDSETS